MSATAMSAVAGRGAVSSAAVAARKVWPKHLRHAHPASASSSASSASAS
eukprot:CAMPEP_0197592128 /NCGR_PEP_ID=MMETSP1326-20131121/14735_1 /TAXON_ID=1155430 /ORGANISM="Genus nov. species nov., Strain RCC2288" /LENGTH=48 /DNA_ID= /DNA_START= /DNA_END= /DNA_ORIENTATION=